VLQLANALTEKWHLLQQAKCKLIDLEGTVAARTRELNSSNDRLRAEIAERTLTAEALRATQERLRHFLARSPVVLYSLKVDGAALIPTWASENISPILGCTLSERLQPDWPLNHICPGDLESVLAARSRLIEHGSSNLEYRLKQADGPERWIRDESKLLRDDATGAAVEVLGAYTDVTERWQLEDQLRQAQKMEPPPGPRLKDNCLDRPDDHFLPKPYRPQSLADAVRRTLDAGKPQ
jgi:PAS domain-containing protein